jgi:agmatine deiminase
MNILNKEGGQVNRDCMSKNGPDLKIAGLFVLLAAILIGASVFMGLGQAEEAHSPQEIILNESIGDESGPIYLRQPAEFEPAEAVLIRYPFGISYGLIAEISEDVEVITIVSSENEKETVLALYADNGVNMSNVDFLIAPTDTYWTRDFSPFFVFMEDGEELVDFTYNRNRGKDDQIPSFYAQQEGLPMRTMPLTYTGGNIMQDGYGLAIATDLVMDDNPGRSADEIGGIAHEYLGVDRYLIVPDANGEYIKHIGCWAKLLSPDVIMIREVPPENPQYDELEAAADYFEMQNSSYGTLFHVVRVYTPNNESYTNSLILNGKVLMPLEGTGWDDEAMEAYENAMPGYEVIGFPEERWREWTSTDSLFCRVKEIPDRGMLYIGHVPLLGSEKELTVVATIIPYSGEELIPESTKVFYKINEGEWQSELLKPIGGDEYTAVIPPHPAGTEISYYIHSEDRSGRAENNPYMGALGPHVFVVG